MSEDLLNITQLAGRLGVRERVIQRYVDARTIPFLKLGKFLRFQWPEVQTWQKLWQDRLPKAFITGDEIVEEPIQSSLTHPQYSLSLHDLPKDGKGIYILKWDAYYKIGKTIKAAQRIHNLIALFPEPLELIHFIETAHHSASELKLHRFFQKQRVNGEWFRLSNRDVAWLRTLTTEYLEELPI